MTNYFSHDVDATNDIKLQNLIMEMGYEGLGFYWHIVEMLYKQNGKLELSQCGGIAFAMRTDSDKIQKLISLVFEKDSKYFWSNAVLKRLKIQKEKSKVAKVSAQKRWKNEAKNGNTGINAKAMPTHSERNAIKEKKNKVNKRKENIERDIALSKNYLKNIPLEDIKNFQVITNATEKQIREKEEALFDYCDAHGKIYKNYKAFLKNALTRDYLKRSDFDERYTLSG